MNILEKEIEDIVFKTSNFILSERGLFLRGVKLRQVNLGSYGIADIVCVDFNKHPDKRWRIHITIIELKRELIDVNTLMQSCRYEKGIKEILIKSHKLKNTEVAINHMLIGKDIQKNGDFVFLAEAMDNVGLYTYGIDLISGITFTNHSGFIIRESMLGCITKKQKSLLKDLINFKIEYPNENQWL